jgi:Cu2+-exporting ATPase
MMIQDFKKKFFISSIASIPVLILSPMIQDILNFSFTFKGQNYVLFVISSFIFFYGGLPFLKGLKEELQDKTPGMMTLIALAISVAYIYSSAVVFSFPGKLFFWELAALIDIMLLGHWIEMKSVLGASKALDKLSQLLPDNAHLMKGDVIEDIKATELKKDDIILIKPGEKIPADGIIVNGASHIDESMLTGESKPVKKKIDDTVIAGSLNSKGSLEIRVQKTGSDSYISKVITLVNDAQKSKSRTQRLADKAALWLTITALTAGTATLIAWLIAGQEIAFAIERMATVMIITCPHALGLAIPLVVAVSTAQSAKNGLLIRNRTAFESSRNISAVVFDKTGTLTEGNFAVSDIEIFNNDYSENDVMEFAASLEQKSEHPIAGGIVTYADKNNISLKKVEDFNVLKGKGIEGVISGKSIMVVSPGYLKENNINLNNDNQKNKTGTTVFIMVEKDVAASITLSDSIRKESYKAIKDLQKMGIKTWMLTGDNRDVAKSVSEELGLDGYFAEVLPHEKQEKIKELQKTNQLVAMTGDGINDAPALAQADVGIAIGSGTDVAAETADIIITESDPQDITTLILFGKATYRKMIQNLIWATGYNVIAIPLAAGVLFSQGIIISPALGAVLMSMSTIIVAINARLLKLKSREAV